MRAPPFALVLSLLSACGPRPETLPSPYVDRDGRGTLIGEACASLRTQGCEEGDPLRNGQTCFEHVTRLAAKLRVPTKCLIDAKTPAEIRSCGTPVELRFECAPTRAHQLTGS